jgi:hypothetical protein
VVFEVTVAVAVLVHPFAGLVTVTTYVPAAVAVGFCWVEENPPGPVQLYVTPLVEEAAVS